MESKLLGEIGKQIQHGVIEFDWEQIRKQPRRYGILYPILGYIVSLIAISLMRVWVFMWLFLVAGFILFFGGIFCANGIIGEYRKIKRISENQKDPSEIEFPSGF